MTPIMAMRPIHSTPATQLRNSRLQKRQGVQSPANIYFIYLLYTLNSMAMTVIPPLLPQK